MCRWISSALSLPESLPEETAVLRTATLFMLKSIALT
jgi:hypothetical protein